MGINSPVFTKINEPFVCANCGFQVPLAQKTCRDHCPKCLFSLHVDVNPGDRQANCGGILKPVAWSQHKKKGYMIHYVCQNCHEKRVNKFLAVDSFCQDSFDTLLLLSNIT